MFYPLTFNYLLFLEREKTMINVMENNELNYTLMYLQ